MPEKEPIVIKNEILSVRYKVKSSSKFSHRVYFESIEFKEDSAGYVIDGKTTLKSLEGQC